MATQFPWLTAMIALPAVSALLIPFIPDKEGKVVRWFALLVGLLDFALMCFVFWNNFDPQTTSFQLAESYTWIAPLGISWSVAVDGLSVPLVLLAGFVTTLSMFSAWQVDRRPRLFYALMLLLYSAQIGVFVAKDLFLFFLMWEVELIPVYLLVCIWGGKRRRYAAMKFLLYTAAASIFILVAALALSLNLPGAPNFDFTAIAQHHFPLNLQLWLYAGLLIAFGVKLAIFPLHTWLPDAHGEASSPISMLLAGVLLKMGGYGLMRFNLELLPDAHVYFAPLLVILGVINIVYGAFSSFGQTNMKRRLAYSSVSHMGFVLIGIASFTDLGMNGAMLQMLSHGLIASVLFFLAGVTYDRTKTMVLAEIGGLGQVMPTVFALFTVGALASLALPGMSGFVGELSVFVGLATSDTYSSLFRVTTVFLSAVGVILTPIYLLSMLREMFYARDLDLSCAIGQPKKSLGMTANEPVCFGNDCVLPGNAIYEDARPREIFIATCFTVLIIAIGLYPKTLMQVYDAKTQALNTSVKQAQVAHAQLKAADVALLNEF
jgi:NAD(P)H-quinone oxidoreductase subunit 4